MKKNLIAITFLVAFLITTDSALAHTVVTPNEVAAGTSKIFTVEVSSEKAQSTVELRLLLPKGLSHVTPTVKPGWYIRVKSEDPANPTVATEIAWFGGIIQQDRRDEFTFSAEVPNEETTLQWKAHQIYSDGSVVSWTEANDEQPKDTKGDDDFSKFGPYSETKVTNNMAEPTTEPESTPSWPGFVSILALILSIIGLAVKAKPTHVEHHHKINA